MTSENNEAKQRQRREWRDKILLYGVSFLYRASEGMFGSAAVREQEQVARLAVELAKLRGDTDPEKHVKDAARLLLTEARDAISFGRTERPRLDRELLEKRADELLREELSDPHPYIPGEKVYPDMPVDSAYVFSDGRKSLPDPPAKLPSGRKPSVPLRKTKTTLRALLRRVAAGEMGKVSEADLDKGTDRWMQLVERPTLSLLHYGQILWHAEAAERERTENARHARKLMADEEKRGKPAPAKLVQQNRSKKSAIQKG